MKIVPLQFQNKIFNTNQFIKAGFTFYNLQQLLKAGLIEQSARGIYYSSGIDLNEEEQFRIATLQLGKPAVICLLSALSFHELTDLIPKQTWIMVPQNKRSKNTKLKLYRAAYPHWNTGIINLDGYRITNIERTIVECLTSRFSLGERPGIEALRKALDKKQTSLQKISTMANKLGAYHRLIQYIKVLT